jgi:hypothetical protein
MSTRTESQGIGDHEAAKRPSWLEIRFDKESLTGDGARLAIRPTSLESSATTRALSATSRA